MRTKTLLLSAVLGALASASVMAQVYSVNAVGYVNVTCPTGYSIIANQLDTGNNVLTNLFVAQIATGNLDGCTIIKYSPVSGFSSYTMDSGQASGWQGSAPNTSTLNPGEAAYFQNITGAPVTLTFVGTVPQGTLSTTNLTGYNLVASKVPQGGGLNSALGLSIDFANGTMDGDAVVTYVNGQFHSYTVDSGQVSGWQANVAEPQIGVAQGFFYQRITANAGSFVWTRTFTVN